APQSPRRFNCLLTMLVHALSGCRALGISRVGCCSDFEPSLCPEAHNADRTTGIAPHHASRLQRAQSHVDPAIRRVSGSPVRQQRGRPGRQEGATTRPLVTSHKSRTLLQEIVRVPPSSLLNVARFFYCPLRKPFPPPFR